MPMTYAGVLRPAEIDEAVAEVARLLAPDVVYIRYHIGEDWNDEWASIFGRCCRTKPPSIGCMK
jgi:S-methylmethionine-dependent homocysteine/selenocysteine methylase